MVNLNSGDLMKKWQYPRAKEDINPDVADLVFHDGALYSLERNNHTIAKLDVNDFKVKARVSYEDPIKALYRTDEPYGMSEGLLFEDDRILVAIDNNGNYFSETAKNRFGLVGNGSAILFFERPPGF